MTLGSKTTLILLLAVSSYALTDLAIQRYVVLPSYEDLEAAEAQRNLTRCLDAVHREVHHLERFCEDWSAWDDTLAFVEGNRPQYVDENLGMRTFVASEINYIAFIASSGRLVWSAGYDLASKDPIGVTELPQGDWPVDHVLLRHKTFDSVIAGIINTTHGPMLLCSRPIQSSYTQTHIGGTLVMGRLLTPDFLNTLRSQTQVDMTLHRAGASTVDPVFTAAQSHIERGDTQWFDSAQRDEFIAYAAVPDVYGSTAFVLRVRSPRTITERGNAALLTDAVGGIAAGAFTLILVLVMLHRSVARPLKALTDQVTSMAELGSLAPVAEPNRNDEIGKLAKAFNTMEARVRTTFDNQVRAETALRESESRMRTILDATPDAIFIVDRAGTILMANPAVRAVLGYEIESILGKNAIDFSPPRLRVRTERILRAFHDRWGRSGKSRLGEFVVLRSDGTETAVHIAASQTNLETGPIIAITVRDITELNALHERIARSQRLAEIGQMGASVAHEIRNPIAGISGAAQVLLKSCDANDPHRPVLEEMLAQSRRVENTVRQLLGYAKPLRAEPTRMDLGRMVQAFAEKCVRDGLLTPHTLQVVPNDIGPCLLDGNLIERLLMNLALNAAQAMRQPGTITIIIERAPRQLSLIVEDDGPGFVDVEQSNLFEPFKTTKVQGTGLGLAICHGIAAAHGGSIRLANRETGGARVLVQIPQGPMA